MKNKYVSQCFRPLFPSSPHSVVSSEQVFIDGRCVTKSVMTQDDPVTRNQDLKPEDFYLENLLANDVDLKDMSLSDCGFVSHDLCVDYLNSKSKSFEKNEN